MKTLTLKRISSFPDGTFGVLIDGVIPFAVTLEREWLDNQQNISCIPEGIYVCERTNSPKFGETFEIINVKDRKNILFHSGNLKDDSQGCILIGEQFEFLHGKTAIISSKKGFNEFMNRLNRVAEFAINIKNDY